MEPKRYAPDFPPGLPCDEFPIAHQAPSWEGFSSGLEDAEERLPDEVEREARGAYEDAYFLDLYGPNWKTDPFKPRPWFW